MSPPKANWINLLGKGSRLRQVIEAWPALVDTDGLRDIPPPQLLPLGPGLKADEEAGIDVPRVGNIVHGPDQGEALFARLQQEIPAQLGLSGTDVILLSGFFLESAGGESQT